MPRVTDERATLARAAEAARLVAVAVDNVPRVAPPHPRGEDPFAQAARLIVQARRVAARERRRAYRSARPPRAVESEGRVPAGRAQRLHAEIVPAGARRCLTARRGRDLTGVCHGRAHVRVDGLMSMTAVLIAMWESLVAMSSSCGRRGMHSASGAGVCATARARVRGCHLAAGVGRGACDARN